MSDLERVPVRARSRAAGRLLGGVLAVWLGLTTACSGAADPANPGGGARTGGPTDAASQAVQYARCMRAHGVPMADPDAAAAPQELPAGPVTDAALKACRRLLPDGGEPPDPAVRSAWQRRFAQCMREQGVPFPDPDTAGSTSDSPGSGGDAPQTLSPQAAAAEKTCLRRLGPPPAGG